MVGPLFLNALLRFELGLTIGVDRRTCVGLLPIGPGPVIYLVSGQMDQ